LPLWRFLQRPYLRHIQSIRSAPCRSSMTIATSPCCAAECSAVQLPLCRSLTLAPCFRSNSTTGKRSPAVALCSGVTLRKLRDFGSIGAPCSSSSGTAATCPKCAARCSGANTSVDHAVNKFALLYNHGDRRPDKPRTATPNKSTVDLVMRTQLTTHHRTP